MPVVEFKEIEKPRSLGTMYRYQDYSYSVGSEDYGYSTQVQVNLHKFNIIKETLKGQWIQDELGIMKPRFVLNHGRKRYAWFTKEEALTSFIARKKKQIRLLESQLRNIRSALLYVGYKEE